MNPEDANIAMSKKEQWKLYLESNRPVTDCVFILDGEEIRAHKLLLTCCSPVFEKMFFGKLASNRISITDICSEDFKQMLKYIYTNTVRIKSVLHAWSLFYIAHKYLLDDFAEICICYIQNNLNINNLVMNYEYAEMYGIDQLQTICMRDITHYVRGIFHEKCDYHMKVTSLAMILQQKILNISNEELVIGVIKWAVIECDIKNINLLPENIVGFLSSQKILHYLIDLDFGINHNLDILVVESCRLMQNLKNPNSLYNNYGKIHWCIFCKCRQTYKIAGRAEMRERDFIFSNISVSKDCLLYGLVVVTENEQVGALRNEYNGIIQIQISEMKSSEIIGDTTFSQILSYETSVYVPLSVVIYLESGKIYTVKIGYKNLDHFNALRMRKSSILCNYMSNRLIDEKRNIVFSFDELDGSVIRGISYYPA